MNIIKSLIRGNKLFRKYHFTDFEEELNDLIKHGQKPQALFITCCDSRITPDLMLGSKPGDLFVMRNIGNFVPPYEKDCSFHGTASAIEYAISVLGVSNIIVCGHSQCGACKSLHEPIPQDDNFQNIRKWLELGKKAKEMTLKQQFKTKEELYTATERNSLICQLENLETYPAIQERIKAKQLKLYAWYYNLSDGSIEYYDKNSNTYKDVINYNDY